MRTIPILLLQISFLFFCSCSTTNDIGSSVGNSQNVNYASLADYLRQNSSVSVKGSEQNIRLQIRGLNSINADTRPFIYIDRNPVGRDYTKANNSVNPDQIDRVEVISSLAKLTVYGQEGHSGIIKIHTKTNQSK